MKTKQLPNFKPSLYYNFFAFSLIMNISKIVYKHPKLILVNKNPNGGPTTPTPPPHLSCQPPPLPPRPLKTALPSSPLLGGLASLPSRVAPNPFSSKLTGAGERSVGVWRGSPEPKQSPSSLSRARMSGAWMCKHLWWHECVYPQQRASAWWGMNVSVQGNRCERRASRHCTTIT
jgi:hypothetical protein